MGKIIAINVSEERGTKKTEVPAAELIEEWGIEGDAHAGKWHRQVSLLSYEKIEEFKKRGADVSNGAFGENIILEGIDLKNLPVGTKLICKEAILEVTQIGKECHSGCEIFQTMGDCIMPREGIFAKVLRGGRIQKGDEMHVLGNHFDVNGNAVMVDVSDKKETVRTAVACGTIYAKKEVIDAVQNGKVQKGDVLGAARIAGIMACKQTSNLIPMCHPIQITKSALDFEIDSERYCITAVCTVRTTGKTGVEMEALTGVTIALLTIYDMCKALDRSMKMGEIQLLEKDGGRSGHFVNSIKRVHSND